MYVCGCDWERVCGGVWGDKCEGVWGIVSGGCLEEGVCVFEQRIVDVFGGKGSACVWLRDGMWECVCVLGRGVSPQSRTIGPIHVVVHPAWRLVVVHTCTLLVHTVGEEMQTAQQQAMSNSTMETYSSGVTIPHSPYTTYCSEQSLPHIYTVYDTML